MLDLTQSPTAILRPGGVSREELEAVLGPVTMAKPARSYRLPATAQWQAGSVADGRWQAGRGCVTWGNVAQSSLARAKPEETRSRCFII